ncbi:DASH family cryptochrome [Trichoderma harzianum]|uniref:DASH family cryptochrome n=1 Tax=Trichoderma harzianum TaxID=5544 RepID=A0A0F9X675_TRIHA|nr:DASH family cryptochrome [Trichoderma harzianum]
MSEDWMSEDDWMSEEWIAEERMSEERMSEEQMSEERTSEERVVIYLVRRDLRVADNHILHLLSRHNINDESTYTHLLPVYVLPPDQVETSGLLKNGERSPYPRAVSENSGVWKCGLHRVKFLAEAIWDMKERLEELDNGLIIRVGRFYDILEGIYKHYSSDKSGPQISSVWMARGHTPEQISEQQEVYTACYNFGIDYVKFRDREPFVDVRDAPLQSVGEVPDVLSDFQRLMEPVIDDARDSIEAPLSLPPFPDHVPLPPQRGPYEIPDTLPELISRLQGPVRLDFSYFYGLDFRGVTPESTCIGGETHGTRRLKHIVKQGVVSRFHTLNDLEESDECLKLTPYLSLGCITARQIHEELLNLENGYVPEYAETQGWEGGENPGTRAVRLWLLCRDFLLLGSRKYRNTLFDLEGSGDGRDPNLEWKSPDPEEASPEQEPCSLHIEGALVQFQVGATGYGLIDAIMRQLLFTGYIGARSYMLIVNFLAKFAGIDWRIGAEWVASLCLDHNTPIQWHRWQQYAGIGPDLTGGETVISPVHTAFELDPNGTFVRKWMPELRSLTRLSNLFQVATTSPELLLRLDLFANVMVTNPVPSDALDLGPTSRVPCGWMHPRIFVPSRQGYMLLGPYPRFLRMQLDIDPIYSQLQSITYPPTPQGLPHPPPGHLWFPVPGTQPPNPQYYLAPHPQFVQTLEQPLAWFFRFIIILRIPFEQARTRAQMLPLQGTQVPPQRATQMPPQRGTQVTNVRDEEPALHNSPRVPAPRTMSASTEVHRAPQDTQSIPAPRRTQSLAAPQGRLGVAQEAFEPPQAPRVESRAPQAPRNAPNAPRAEFRPLQAPPNAPNAPRAHSRPHQAPRNAPNVPQAYIQRSQVRQSNPTVTVRPSRGSQAAPPNAPHGPRIGFGPPRASQHAPRAPRADYQPYLAPQNAPRAPRAQFLPYHSYQPYQVPTNIYMPAAPRADSWLNQAPQMAPRAPRTMRTPPNTPPQSPPVFNDPQAPGFPELSSLAGELDAASRYGFQQYYNAPGDPLVPTFYGLNTFSFNHPGTVQPIDGAAYHQTLQDYHQWRTSNPALNAFYIGPPEPEEVLRHGMILRFLDSLPPTPPNPSFPPDPPRLLRRTRRRRPTRSSADEYGSSSMAGPSEEVAAAEDTAQGNVRSAQGNAESAQGGQGKRNRRGRRGRRGRGRGKSEEGVGTEEVMDELAEEAEDELTEEEVQNELTEEEVQGGVTEEVWDELTEEIQQLNEEEVPDCPSSQLG